MSPKIPITHQELDDLYNRQRLSLAKIAARLNVGKETVRYWMDKFNLPRRSTSEAGRKPLDDEEIEWLYVEKRLSLAEIAQRFGVDAGTVLNRLKARGVERRGSSEAQITYERHDFSGDPLEKAYLQGFCRGDVTVKMATDGSECATIVEVWHNQDRATQPVQ